MSSQPKSRTPSSLRQGTYVVEMQRRRLLLALVEIASDEGLEGVSVGGICKRAGVSRRTFYENFEDCDACLLAAFEDAVRQFARVVLPAYEREHRWDARIRAGLVALLRQLDAESALARLCVIEAPRAGPKTAERHKRVLDALTTAVDEGHRQAKQGNALPVFTAQGVAGGVLSVIHAHLLEDAGVPLATLASPLMGMIVHPYLGPAAARRELRTPAPSARATVAHIVKDPFKDIPIRFTYRTARVLARIAAHPGASNRAIAERSGIVDEGQMSRLLRRLQQAGLIQNKGHGQSKGEANAWALTDKGQAIQAVLQTR